ncbi:MAG TPA: response regulator transcription factor [Clostridia bacterium]|nr:response regulator transcription factor [Clostridia bacterium]
MKNIRLLIADGNPETRNVIKEIVTAENFFADETADGISALKLFKRNDYKIIILDTELPELDGYNVCRQIRKVSDVPIIITSYIIDEAEKLCFFEAGVDDYVVKPFYPSELMARIKVFLHRSSGLEENTRFIYMNEIYIDTVSRTVHVDDKPIQLTPKEYDLLMFMAKNPNKALSRDVLLNEVWGFDFFGSDRTIDTHIKTLRESLKPYQYHITTVWGFGYKFEL